LKNKNDLIVKSNYIIEASYKLSLGEQRIIYMLTSMIKYNDCEFKVYKINVKDFINLIGTKSNDTYAQVLKYVEDLREKDLSIKKEKSILKIKWLSSAEYFIDEGYIELCFDPKLKPYLLELKNAFTKLSLTQMVSFTSQYSARIYELLMQYKKIKERTFELNHIKLLLGIDIDEYKYYSSFKQRVITTAIKEINDKSDLYVDFEEIKTGRKVTSIKFNIKSKMKEETTATLELGQKECKVHTKKTNTWNDYNQRQYDVTLEELARKKILDKVTAGQKTS
jgi:plasmid replication initiation protein